MKVDEKVRSAIFQAVEQEAFAKKLGIKLVELELGFSAVEMNYDPETMSNIYHRAHGGAIFSLIDEAFETVSQAYGTIAVALNVTITYVSSPETAIRLRAEAREISKTKKTASYTITVTDADGQTIANCQALAYDTGKPIPFL